MNIKAIAIDDEPRALDVIGYHAEKVPFLELCRSFRNPFEATAYLNNNAIDLLFLDINMPDISGVQYVKTLEHRPFIIFTTAYSEFAVESYELNAIDYLLKPIELDRFCKAVNKVLKAKTSKVYKPEASLQSRRLFLKSGTEVHKIDPRNILYIKSDGNYMVFHLLNKRKVMARMNINDTLSLLEPGHFSQVHRSYIVAHDHLSTIKKDKIIIKDKEIPLGNSFKRAFLKKINRDKEV